MKKTLVTLALSSVLSGQAAAEVCSTEGYVVGFFNGVWNTPLQANLALDAFRSQIGDVYQGENVEYELFYNTTGSKVGATDFQDIAEVFIQRADEIELGLGKRFDLFWSAVSGDSDNFLDKVISVSKDLDDAAIGLLEGLYDWAATETAGLVAGTFSNPPTQADYAAHSSRVKTLGTHGTKMLLIAHSQGNLFANNAYDAALSLSNIDESHIKVVHIAPASSVVKGDHILADNDVVINGLRVLGTVPETNVEIPLSHIKTDPTGHMLLPTYLNTDLDTSTMVSDSINNAMASLQDPVSTAATGAFTVTLTWDGLGDVDLHTYEPNGSHVYWGDKVGEVGELDVDNRESFGPEHYYATCNEALLQEGNYTVAVKNFRGAEGRTAVAQVSTPRISNLITKKIVMTEELGTSGSPTELFDVNISKTDGEFVITAN